MSIRKSIYPLVTLALMCGVVGANATTPTPPVPQQYDGRYYQVVIANKITWDAAKSAAEQRAYQGIQGHLATIGSPEEDAFIQQLRQQTLSAPHAAITGSELWVGGYQLPCQITQPEPGCGWIWLNGESISPVNVGSPYTHWLPGEPNNLRPPPNANNIVSEDHLAIGKNGAFGWNDEGHLPNVWGYVIEYGDKVSVPAQTCSADEGGCNPTGAQVLSYPDSASIAPNATLTARTFRFHDDPNRCGKRSLSLFNGAVIIPQYLCGHPDFLVIETAASGVEVLTGTILVENLTKDVLPDNLYGCDDVRQNPAGQIDPDPAHRDVVAWQSSDPAKMLETSLGTGRFAGTLAEVTYGCGSSRGKVLNGSYQFVGLRIYPGDSNEYALNALGNHQSFVDLTRYKLELLQASVVASKAAVPKINYLALKVLVDATLYLHDRGKYKAALLNIRLFQDLVEHTRYKAIPGENFNGDHLMRASNVQFIYTDKLIPFAP
ncbi:MAG TPA: hypothetical protein VGN07_14005 [Steroidobacteraceae bacterium]